MSSIIMELPINTGKMRCLYFVFPKDITLKIKEAKKPIAGIRIKMRKLMIKGTLKFAAKAGPLNVADDGIIDRHTNIFTMQSKTNTIKK